MVYFPNGSAGEILDTQCFECPIADDAPCPVLFVQLTYNYVQIGNDDLRDVMNTLIDADGQCQMKPFLDKATMHGRRKDDRQIDLPNI